MIEHKKNIKNPSKIN